MTSLVTLFFILCTAWRPTTDYNRMATLEDQQAPTDWKYQNVWVTDQLTRFVFTHLKRILTNFMSCLYWRRLWPLWRWEECDNEEAAGYCRIHQERLLFTRDFITIHHILPIVIRILMRAGTAEKNEDKKWDFTKHYYQRTFSFIVF